MIEQAPDGKMPKNQRAEPIDKDKRRLVTALTGGMIGLGLGSTVIPLLTSLGRQAEEVRAEKLREAAAKLERERTTIHMMEEAALGSRERSIASLGAGGVETTGSKREHISYILTMNAVLNRVEKFNSTVRSYNETLGKQKFPENPAYERPNALEEYSVKISKEEAATVKKAAFNFGYL